MADEERNTVAGRDNGGPQIVEKGATPDEPDVMLHVPVVKVDEISLEVDNLRARVSLAAGVANLVSLDAGADVLVDRVKLDIKGVEAEALLKVRLEKVYAIIERTLTALEHQPGILTGVLRPVADSVGELGRGLGQAAPELGSALGQTVGEVGQAVGETAGAAGQSVGQAAGAATGALGPSVGQAVGETAEAAGQPVRRRVDQPAAGRLPAARPTVPERGGRPPGPAAVGAVREEDSSEPEDAGEDERGGSGRVVLLGGDTPALEAWMTVGEGRVVAAGRGFATEPGGDLGLAFFTEPFPGDVTLDLRFRLLDDDARSALYVRSRDPRQPVPDRQDPSNAYPYDNPAYVPVDTAVEVEISRTGAGTIRGAAAPRQGQEIRRGEWHELRVEAHGQRYRAFLDGKATTELKNTDAFRGKPPESDPASGFVGIRLERGRVELDQLTASPTSRGGRLLRLVQAVPRGATAAARRVVGARRRPRRAA